MNNSRITKYQLALQAIDTAFADSESTKTQRLAQLEQLRDNLSQKIDALKEQVDQEKKKAKSAE
jgi:hypothetical protein